MNIFTYHLEKSLPVYIDVEDKAFNFREFFRTWTGDIQKDFKRIPSSSKIGDFVHEDDIIAFLDLITREDENTNYPFSTEQYREFFRHSLWVVPGVKEAKALSEILNKHRIFKNFKIVNVAGDGDEEIDKSDALFAVKNAMTDEPNLTYTITITCGRLTTGVSVPEWTAVLMLAGTYSTSASQYLQTIFRVQTPANINGKIKNECYVFDFAPDRTLKMVAESVQLSAKAGVKNITAEMSLKKFLNYRPVISISESTMTIYKVSELLQELKKAYAERVAKNGFDDPKIYNDELLMLTEVELKDFEELKKIVGNSKQTKRTGIIDINNQGFNEEELEEEQELKRKPKKELTEEEKARLQELKDKRKNRDTAISILRAISIRMPLLVYGMDHDISVDIAIENFADAIDDLSWEEFMPSGVTKDIFKQFSKYYDKDIFVAASRRIRYISKSADELEPIERVNKIASLFSTFKNPDKETVLTPWKVVNMHLGRTIGGSNFYDENYSYMIQDPREIEIEGVTKKIFNEDSKILEINSKTGLYPLHMAFSFYNKKISELNEESLSFEEKNNIWDDIIKKKIFVICKTPMAKLITKRTLLGYRKGKTNMHAFDDLVMQLKDKPDKFVEKITKGRFWNLGGIKNMKFNAIVGNPPYQVQKGGTKNIDIWQHFVTVGSKTGKHSSFIHPGRWVIPKKQMVSVSNNIMSSGLKHFDYYPNSLSFFEGVDIDGGITITFFEKNYEGDIFYSINGIEKGIFTQNERIFINEYEEEIYEKIIKKYNGETFMDRRIFGNIGSLGGSEFGYQKTTMIKLLKDSPQGLEDPIKIWANSGHGKGTRFSWHYIDNKHVTPPVEIMKTRKVMIDKKGHAITKGRGNVINNKPQILDKKTIASGDVLFVIPEIDDSNHLKFIKNMFLSKTIRFLMTLTQKDLYVRGFENIPDYKWFMEIFKDETLNDTNLYKKFNFSRELIEHIERSVSEK
ncbi:MAG: Eco57I restriction-modification methylase domain-containing protein [Candidatus Cloacimonetes bacterium]|nr:Eco57I restriction-modification methylase domain-containing protein [Candidatus Cloacimonadota bacterium]